MGRRDQIRKLLVDRKKREKLIFVVVEAYVVGLALPLEAYPESSRPRWAEVQRGKPLLADGERRQVHFGYMGRQGLTVVGVWCINGPATPEELDAELSRVLAVREAERCARTGETHKVDDDGAA